MQNNAFAYATTAQLQHTRSEDHLAFTFRRNIVLWDQGDLFNGNWTGSQTAMDDNVYWDESSRPVTFAGMSFADWQKTGHDAHSVVADPQFVHPRAFDFALKQNSPARTLGFEPISLRGVGATEGSHAEAATRE